ncbi:caspase family protein [Nostoc sp.]|uniref:caspase family protein n=1 Tax=Nostoc sp. TaxID=1180 RepID=UPI002FF70D63
MKPEVASRRIDSFGQRFGEAHLYLAYHAAFPLALTPDLLYRLWANFQRDIHRQELKIPWLAVADLLLSSLCDEVGHELYEMDTAVRNALLKELKKNLRFGEKRINELSDFLLTYVRQQLESHDPDIRDFAQAQKWTALAYTRPSEAALELALTLSKLKLEEKAEWVRMAYLVETFAEPLAGFEPLLVYARGMANFVRNNFKSAEAQFNQLPVLERQVKIAGVSLDIPLESTIPVEEISLNQKFTTGGTKTALLIGVSDFEPGLNRLPASVKDMQAIAKVLQHPEMGGFAQTNIQKLENPDPQKMYEAIETLFSDRRKDDLVVLYYSGHGIKDQSGKLYLATRLTRKNPQGQLIKSTTLPASFIHDIMNESRCKRQVIILDCCFSGAFAEGWSVKEDGSVDIRTQLGGEGRVVLTSTTSTQYSFEKEGEELSIYTRYLVEGIETGAADLNNDGAISVDELHEYVRKKVREAAPAMKPEIYAFKEGFKIILAKAPIGDPKLRYRKEVEIYGSRGEIPIIGRRILDALRQNLGLLPEETAAIEAEILKPYREYQQKLQQYEQALVDAIGRKQTLSDYTRNELRRYQKILGLRDEETAAIEAEVLKPYREYQQKLQQYEQALVDAIGREQTLSDYTRNDLRRYQEILELRDEDIAPIEARVTASAYSINDFVPNEKSSSDPPDGVFKRVIDFFRRPFN